MVAKSAKKIMSISRFVLFISALLIIVLLTVAPGLAQGPPFQPPQPTGSPAFVPGEVLVKFKPHVGLLGAQSSLRGSGLRPLEVSPRSKVIRVQVAPGFESGAISRLLARGDVEFATYNYYVEALGDPNDTYYGLQWALKQIDDHDIDAPEAWDIHTGTNNITIAIIDTGVDLDHPDLQANIVAGYDFVNKDFVPDDDYGHGTHVAGIAAAVGNNAQGIAGVSWAARIMPLKVLDSSGNGTIFNVADAIDYAVANGAKVINMSLGAPGTSYPCSGFETIRDAMQNALDNGRLVVVAAGNESASAVSCPAAYDQAMAVGSTTSGDTRSSFSNFGPRLDIAAPGSSIYSTYPGGNYTYLSGTSMATPHVAGLAALLWSFAPSLTNTAVRQIIQNTADDLGAAGWDPYFGYGRINAHRALESVSLQTSPAQLLLLADDLSGPVSGIVQITTANPNVITWTTGISPAVGWLQVSPPVSGTVSTASSPAEVTLVASTSTITYGTYTATMVVTGTTSSEGLIGPRTSQVELHYVPELYRYYYPIIFKE